MNDDLEDDLAPDVRDGFALSAAAIPDMGDMVAAVHRRARRTRRRRAALAGVAAALTAATAVGVGLAVPRGASQPAASPTVETSTAGPTATTTAPGPAGESSAPSATVGPTTAPAATGWPRPEISDDFTGGTLDRSLWAAVYSGPDNALGRWSPSEVTVGSGTLRLAVNRSSSATPPSTFGGVGAVTTLRRYGRWEFRWRMTAGRGVIGQFVLSPEQTVGNGQSSGDGQSSGSSQPSGGGQSSGSGKDPAFAVTLSAVDGKVSVSGGGGSGWVSSTITDPTGYHTVAVEWTPQSLRTTVDGAVVAESAGPQPAAALWPALQAWSPGPDCGANPLPADCGGASTRFPQRLEVDWIRYQPYRR